VRSAVRKQPAATMRSPSWRALAGAAVVCALSSVRPGRADGHIGSWTRYNGGSFGSITFNDVQSVEYDHRVPMDRRMHQYSLRIADKRQADRAGAQGTVATTRYFRREGSCAGIVRTV
jgi:hypothetical protein